VLVGAGAERALAGVSGLSASSPSALCDRHYLGDAAHFRIAEHAHESGAVPTSPRRTDRRGACRAAAQAVLSAR